MLLHLALFIAISLRLHFEVFLSPETLPCAMDHKYPSRCRHWLLIENGFLQILISLFNVLFKKIDDKEFQ